MMRNVRAITAIALGAAAATSTVLLTFQPPNLGLVTVPRALAAPTSQQRTILRLARKDGVGSGILYVWGGTTTSGFDCSGFVWHVLRTAGVNLTARTTYTQFAAGTPVRYSDLRLGDVVFFVAGGSPSSPGHEGLYLGHGTFVEYYTSGLPARYSRLPGYRYAGARRFWHPLQIRRRDLPAAAYVARHWHLQIAGHAGDTVVFVSPHKRHHRWFATWKRKAIIAWAHKLGHPVQGSFSHININVWRHKPVPPTHWSKVKKTAAWVAHHFRVRLTHHTSAGVATYRTRSGKRFAPWRRRTIVRWAHNHNHKATVPDRKRIRISLWPG